MPAQCITGGMTPYVPTPEKPWDARRVAHLYRRMGFGATQAQIAYGLTQNPSDLVDELITQAVTGPTVTQPTWYNWQVSDYTDYGNQIYQHWYELVRSWQANMQTNPVLCKLMLFWHNHFVTGWYDYGCSQFLWNYHNILQTYAFGSFKEFTMAIGKCPSMLIYLGGAYSTKNGINENYARELMELFTLGEGNGYTEDDVVEVAHALTGWTRAFNCAYYANDDQRFVASSWDSGVKTIFGETGNWGFNDVHDLIFTKRQTQMAKFICRKIYKYYICHTPDEAFVNDMALQFKLGFLQTETLLRKMFKSEHFFDDNAIGCLIKSPIEMFTNLVKTSELYIDDNWRNNFFSYSNALGQLLYNPINVAGWPGHHTWVSETTAVLRFIYTNSYLSSSNNTSYLINLVNIAKALTSNSHDPKIITKAMVDFFTPNGLPHQAEYDAATAVFKGNIPDTYFENGTWTLDSPEAKEMCRKLLIYITRHPEFQLM
ncbi:MAG: DUF1800 domain-containing protein [Sphingobacteriales bacterium]|jgi:hypothetical protein|nr:DUF1800 domain-containing protein [Sphingobacteriales bacterium]MBP9142075.1 DUF1800 domain-containing protein [Chitinophagales bacterium]MDA0198753.1 DUF1800 family protein [Bacteroidota bacterium]MBK6889572.1 DUF1800 domain-containing protein [Sphingobacteriales bacterium]MBK7527923.1 DUF1800 domain-containing protein [Sphingobacteriales bacterium]